nr:MAG TPA: hypothetical protein [Caudoviricetes sp.]
MNTRSKSNGYFLLYLRLAQYNIFTQYDFFHKILNPTRSGFGQGVFFLQKCKNLFENIYYNDCIE